MELPPMQNNQQQNQMPPQQHNLYDPSLLPRSMPSNMPIMDRGGAMIDALLDDNNVKESKRKKFFFVFGRDNSLTFLDNDSMASKMMAFDITKIDMLNSTPYYDYTFEEEFEWNVMRNIFETKLNRSKGIVETIKNERIIQQSQFSENRDIQAQEDIGGEAREGFLKRLLKKR